MEVPPKTPGRGGALAVVRMCFDTDAEIDVIATAKAGRAAAGSGQNTPSAVPIPEVTAATRL